MYLNNIKTLFLGLTNKCNAKCITCWHSNTNIKDTLELPLCIYNQIKKDLFPHIRVLDVCGGGEVFLSPLFNTLVEDIKNYNFKTIITSNFSSITNKQREDINKLNIDFVVSLDGSNEELQNKLRPGCDFNTVIDNIKYFVSSGHKVIIQVTVSKDNFYDIENLILLAEKLKVKEIRFYQVRFLNNLEQPYKFNDCPVDYTYLENISKKKYKVRHSIYLDYFHKGSKKTYLEIASHYILGLFKDYSICQKLTDSLKIQEDGRILTCCLPDSKILGDLNLYTLEYIFNSFNYKNIRRNCTCSLKK